MENIYSHFLQCSSVSTDTRTIAKDTLFICLKGENFNGNKFALEALNKGAKFVLIDEKEYYIDHRTLLVEDCLKTLQELANFHRKQFNIPIIGITGSNGKTTTKELTAHLLSQQYNVLYTKRNLNNHIGVPLTLLNLREEHELAIIEMGANHPDDIKELCNISAPNFGIITNIGKAHLLGFKTIEGVIQTKTALYRSVIANNGTLFVNHDDSILTEHCSFYPKVNYYTGQGTTSSFISGSLTRLTPFIHLTWQSDSFKSQDLETQIIGEYNFYNLLAAITIATYFNVSTNNINKGIISYRNENNRSQLKATDTNELIMDAYNANPSSMTSAINSFSKIERSNKTMILGDMFELGEESFEEHSKIILLANQTNIPTFFIGKYFYEHKSPDSSNFFESKEDFISYLKIQPFVHQFILLKGSRGIALEELLTFL